ncbi:hypothetical protein MBCUT_11340 [Methanobrevibacter cuticularis]|uniref:Uncharacterized protein n=1 Tax=Methanobrevibacter cuticularis TaxID=47311 RepID=A0A166DVM9_9EURY|nr:hypothetical protein [Methanobrevibacter cuticularis]KZX15998.1 hypothetical protein MBCUT_11340 [Methanobrevibacter cuticularis]
MSRTILKKKYKKEISENKTSKKIIKKEISENKTSKKKYKKEISENKTSKKSMSHPQTIKKNNWGENK